VIDEVAVALQACLSTFSSAAARKKRSNFVTPITVMVAPPSSELGR
jgi:hypothetical protein